MAKKSNITLKVILGLIVVVAAIVAALFGINRSLKIHAERVKKIDDPNYFISAWDRALVAIDNAGNEIFIYTSEGDSAALKRFDNIQSNLLLNLDTLRNLAGTNLVQKKLVDSLAILTDRRLELYLVRSYTVIDNSDMNEFDEAKNKLEKAPTNRKKNTVEAKPITDPVKAQKQKAPEKTNVLRRFFSRRDKKNKNNTDTPQATNPVVETPKSTVTTKTLVEVIEDLRNAELKKREENQKKVLSLVEEEKNTDRQIYNLTRLMEKLEINDTQSQIKDTSASLEADTDRIMLLMGIGGTIFILTFIIIIQRDVSRSNKLQKQLDNARINAENLAKARQDFAANMSHEIRTPLNALVGFSEQLSKTPLNEQQKVMVDALGRSSHHLLNVINPVLDYSKLIAGKTELELVPFKLTEVLLDAKFLYEKMANEKGLKLIIEGSATIDNLKGDVVKLRQVVYNLLSNAIKFTHQGHVKITTQTISLENNTVQLVLAIHDTGIGIPEDKRDSVFEEFTQADNSITRNYGGTGLGLNIVKRLVEMQNGSIGVSAGASGGSIFTVTVPYQIADTIATTQTPADQAISKTILQNQTVVVCDDEEMNRMLLTHILCQYGANVIEVENSNNLIKEIEQHKPVIVLLDLHMPGMGGFEAYSLLRANPDNAIAQTPVIAVTGNVVAGEKEKCLASGMKGFINKPFMEKQLMETIQSAIAG